MKCVVPGLNIKIFARAIHSLAKVGDELYVEPSSSGVFFRTVNSSRSAFGSYFFKSSFFSHYDFKITGSEQEENFKCKVAMKACLNAFKSVNNIEKSVEKCRLAIDPQEDRLMVNMSCRHGINKTYNLCFIECETLEAVFDKSICHFGITSQSRVLSDAFINFQANQEEVTLLASPQKILIRNYVDDDPDPAKSIHTELTLEADEFDNYNINENCEVTFCLKEVRALITFSEPLNLPICLVFTKPGSPIIFSVENSSIFEANFVLATLSTGPQSSQVSAQSQQLSRQNLKAGLNNSLKRPPEVNENSEMLRNNSMRRSSEYIVDLSSRLSKCTNNSPSPTTSRYLARNNLTTPSARSSFGLSSQPFVAGDGRAPEEEEEEELPGTPPAKKRRFYFKRCFEPTFNADNISSFKRILAEDSDDDDANALC